MDFIWFIFLFVINAAWPLFLLILLIIGFFALRFVYRAVRSAYEDSKSLEAAGNDETSLMMDRMRIKARRTGIIGVIAWPVSFAAIVFSGVYISDDFLSGELSIQLTLLAASICSGVFLIRSGLMRAEYNRLFKDNFVAVELSKVYSGVRYEPSNWLGAGVISDLNFFKNADEMSGNDLIEASYKGIRFRQCDLSLIKITVKTDTDDDGNEKSREIRDNIFKGRAMAFEFQESFRGVVQVLQKTFQGAAVSAYDEWKRVETELIEFNNRFNVFAADPLDAMAVLTPQMIEGIYELEKSVNAPLAFYYTGKSMFVFISMRRNSFDTSGTRTLLQERELLKQDISLITELLDTMYFRRQ